MSVRSCLQCRQLGGEKFAGSRTQLGGGDGAFFPSVEDGSLGEVIAVRDPGFALEHAPGLAAFDAEEDDLAGDGKVPSLPIRLHGDEDSEVGHVAAMVGEKDVAPDDVILGDENEDVVQGDKRGGGFRRDGTEVLCKSRLGRGPSGHGE